ncbi:hypothetical protein [Sulfitobacter donghicola]|uniref:Uncharacterized protein n=1 Tax=Sulfitobacter donghicola DSW-25 = KCTC 12864 = JCM 14565 TaxID=1300350 RepID=A0A073IIZ1_9RHOB|nr:hypothetical protein [Sulfitobacter donghicola]KEJ90298.1 hypothetical protein DSW25_05790 [Sulfitobacter donghicola DSW-25 = KCTC 12864 = JCM 14565]KIN67168.1 hypothetical protein Z948_874 [Sulfitobacter donghicola DSW-25 = KCTC 12864 = JCM 14565]
MAYLTPQTLTCPSCSHTGPLTWITGIPLDNKPRAGRGYVKVHKSGDWIIEKTKTETIVNCPTCNTEVTRRSRTP